MCIMHSPSPHIQVQLQQARYKEFEASTLMCGGFFRTNNTQRSIMFRQ